MAVRAPALALSNVPLTPAISSVSLPTSPVRVPAVAAAAAVPSYALAVTPVPLALSALGVIAAATWTGVTV